MIGYNYRMSNFLAGIGRAQLELLDDRVIARRAIFKRYLDALGAIDGLELIPELEGTYFSHTEEEAVSEQMFSRCICVQTGLNMNLKQQKK